MDFNDLEKVPVTYQGISDYFSSFGNTPVNPFELRKETMLRIEKHTGRPIICYVTKTNNVQGQAPAYIDHSDLTGFGDLLQTTEGENVDVFIVSNGGLPEAAERIVKLLRRKFKHVRFIVPANAYSAATLICFSGDQIIMDTIATLGPIDPQINGTPARAILRGFENVEKILKRDGPSALAVYMPLIAKYDISLLEICKSAQILSSKLAKEWLSHYMLKDANRKNKRKISSIVKFFSDFDKQNSHARSIDYELAKALGLNVSNLEEDSTLADLVRSLYNQYEIWFDKLAFYKMYENPRGISWGKETANMAMPYPILIPQTMPAQAPKAE
jgi:hypothetical protein